MIPDDMDSHDPGATTPYREEVDDDARACGGNALLVYFVFIINHNIYNLVAHNDVHRGVIKTKKSIVVSTLALLALLFSVIAILFILFPGGSSG
jgi:hypothetical protein